MNIFCGRSRSKTIVKLQEKTGMVLIEVEFVTGWEAENPETLTDLKEVQRVETDKEENKVIKNIGFSFK